MFRMHLAGGAPGSKPAVTNFELGLYVAPPWSANSPRNATTNRMPVLKLPPTTPNHSRSSQDQLPNRRADDVSHPQHEGRSQ